MFSKACEYGIRAILYVAANSNEKKRVGIAEICDHIAAPSHFTAKVMQTLSRHRLVSSQKGMNGGFFTDAAQRNKPLIEVVSAIDGNVLFTGCAMGLRHCSSEHPCPVHNQFMHIRNELTNLLQNNSIGDLADKYSSGIAFLKSLGE